jgi:GntR family transcriptional regulator
MMFSELNPQAPIPLYRQLSDQLMGLIRSGHYPPGSRIPSEHQLAEIYAVGRPTIRQALDLLVRKGVLTRRRGSGTYVCERQQEVDLFSLDGTFGSFQKKGLAVSTHIMVPLQRRKVSQNPDNPFSDGEAYFFSRLTRVDQEPVLLEDLYLHAELFAGIDRIDLAGRSLSAVAEEQYYLRPTGGKQRFSIRYLDAARGRQLQVTADTPVLAVQRFLHFPQTQSGVYSELWCRTDRFVFSQTIGGAVYA